MICEISIEGTTADVEKSNTKNTRVNTQSGIPPLTSGNSLYFGANAVVAAAIPTTLAPAPIMGCAPFARPGKAH